MLASTAGSAAFLAVNMGRKVHFGSCCKQISVTRCIGVGDESPFGDGCTKVGQSSTLSTSGQCLIVTARHLYLGLSRPVYGMFRR